MSAIVFAGGTESSEESSVNFLPRFVADVDETSVMTRFLTERLLDDDIVNFSDARRCQESKVQNQ